jgi:hypothetical protein
MGQIAMRVGAGMINSCLTPLGKVGVVVGCHCGHVTAVEMTMPETQILIALLQANLELAAKVQALPAPFVHEEGHA